jgi:RNA polymerase sigma-70 factor (ECF subfamily)
MRRPPPAESAHAPVIDWVDERQAGRDAILALYDAHQAELFSFLLYATHHAATAEDLLQEAFLRLIRETRRGRAPDTPRAWLYRVCANLVTSQGRRRRSAERWESRIAPPEPGSSAEEDFLRREEERRLNDALVELPADARSGLLLSAHGFRGEEIAQLLGRSQLATRSLLFRARATLRDRLRPGRSDDV